MISRRKVGNKRSLVLDLATLLLFVKWNRVPEVLATLGRLAWAG